MPIRDVIALLLLSKNNEALAGAGPDDCALMLSLRLESAAFQNTYMESTVSDELIPKTRVTR